MPQGFLDSPTVYAAALNMYLSELALPGSSALLQYVEDLLLASPNTAGLLNTLSLYSTTLPQVVTEHVSQRSSFVNLRLTIGICAKKWMPLLIP